MSVSIVPENCEYRAEGNVGIVVRLIEEEKVLRLKKQDNVCNGSPSLQDALKELEDQNKIIKNVLKPILGKAFVHCPLVVFLQAEEVRMLNKTVSRFRPVHRRHKSVKEEDIYVSMLPDFCSLPQNLKVLPSQGPVLSIEIKPKQGFMKEEYLLSSSSSLSIPMCRFCMKQRYKLKKGLISTKSGYCPTDLFSGCYTRMFHAMKMLCKTPQNNFRIFKDQKLIYSEEKKDVLHDLLADFFVSSGQIRHTDLLCDLVLQALIKPCSNEMNQIPVLSKRKYLQTCINAHTLCAEKDPCHELSHSCILERVLNCQLLDDLNTADLYQLYQEVKEGKDKCSDYIGCYSRSEIPPHIGELRRNSDESQYQYASRKVWEFLMALTVKDCSIMLVLKHLTDSSTSSQSQNVISDKYGNLYIFSIAIADLDAKLLKKVEKVYHDTSFLLESFDV